MTSASGEMIGLVGVGRMGLAFVGHLIRHGYRVTAYDIAPERADAARAAGATVVDTPAAVGLAATFVIIAVGYDNEASAVMLDSGGLLETMGRSSSAPNSVIAVSSTCTPGHVKMLAARAAKQGVDLLDAPICRGQKAADDGTMLTLCGGAPEVFERACPILGAFSADVVHLGEIGAGQLGKAMNNLLLWVNGVALIEAGRLCEANGVDPRQNARRAVDQFGRLRRPEELGQRLVHLGAEGYADRVEARRRGRPCDAGRGSDQGTGQGRLAHQADEPARLDWP